MGFFVHICRRMALLGLFKDLTVTAMTCSAAEKKIQDVQYSKVGRGWLHPPGQRRPVWHWLEASRWNWMCQRTWQRCELITIVLVKMTIDNMKSFHCPWTGVDFFSRFSMSVVSVECSSTPPIHWGQNLPKFSILFSQRDSFGLHLGLQMFAAAW